MNRRLLILLALIVTIALNLVLLRYANTLLWPYLWPQPGVYLLIGLVVAMLWAPGLLRGVWPLRLLGPLMIFIGQSYLIHSFQATIVEPSLPAVLHLLGFTGTLVVMTLSYVNQIAPRDNCKPPALPARLPAVAAVIPTYGEPIDILAQTVAGLKALNYPADKLYIVISDDGHRDEVRALAAAAGVHYNPGARRDAKAGNLNAALGHIAQHFPQATLILTQDADELIHPQFLKKIVGYFAADPQLAFVQTPKEAFTPQGDPFGNRDRIFYDVLQPGRNGSNAAFSCGSGVLWRIDALRAIGGFSTWNIVEDMTTSYLLHCAGYNSEYHNEVLTIGLSPDDIPGLLKQRGTWAADTWRWFLFKNPLLSRGLRLRQRLQYLELGMFYMSSVFFMPLLMLTPILSLLTGQFVPIEGSALFPWLLVSALFYMVLSQGRVAYLFRMWQYWIGHWPTYTRALRVALSSRRTKPSYKVTRKTHQDGFYGQMVWQQFIYIAVGALLGLRALLAMPEVALATRLVNIGAILFYSVMLFGICRAAFYGTTTATWQGLAGGAYRFVARKTRALSVRMAAISRTTYQRPLFPSTVELPVFDDEAQLWR